MLYPSLFRTTFVVRFWCCWPDGTSSRSGGMCIAQQGIMIHLPGEDAFSQLMVVRAPHIWQGMAGTWVMERGGNSILIRSTP